MKFAAFCVLLVVGAYLGLGWLVAMRREDVEIPGWAAVLCVACMAGAAALAVSHVAAP